MKQCVQHYDTMQHRVGTLYAGSLGPLVFLRYRLAKYLLDVDKEKARQLFRDALVVAEQAIRYEEQYKNDRKRWRVSLLESIWVGAKVLQCAILYHLNQSDKAVRQVQEVLQFLAEACQSLPAAECEVLYGRSGAVHGILFLRQELQDKTIGRDVVIALASDVVREGLASSQSTGANLPLLWEWHGKAYLGAAHGVVGILQTLLSLERDELDAIDQNLNINTRDLIRQTIDGLEQLCFPSGNLQSSIGSPRDKLVHWCHGAPGYVMLLTKASLIFENEAYLERAKTIGNNVLMQRGLLRNKGVGLCHGISGNAYALLSIGRATNEYVWIQNAKLFAHFALEHFQDLALIPDHPYSLFEGCAGLGALLLDLCRPEGSSFPLYEFN